jgi:hypothetical protein
MKISNCRSHGAIVLVAGKNLAEVILKLIKFQIQK